MSISLLPIEERARKVKITVFIRRTFPLVLIFYIVSILVFGGLFVFFGQRAQGLSEKKEVKIKEIGSMRDRESSRMVVKDRLRVLASFPKSPFQDTFDKTAEAVGGDLGLEILEVTSDPQRVRLSVRGQDSFIIERFLDNITQKLDNLVFESLTRETDGRYVATLFAPL